MKPSPPKDFHENFAEGFPRKFRVPLQRVFPVVVKIHGSRVKLLFALSFILRRRIQFFFCRLGGFHGKARTMKMKKSGKRRRVNLR